MKLLARGDSDEMGIEALHCYARNYRDVVKLLARDESYARDWAQTTHPKGLWESILPLSSPPAYIQMLTVKIPNGGDLASACKKHGARKSYTSIEE